MESTMQMPFVTTVSFADRDGMIVLLQYGVAAPSESLVQSTGVGRQGTGLVAAVPSPASPRMAA